MHSHEQEPTRNLSNLERELAVLRGIKFLEKVNGLQDKNISTISNVALASAEMENEPKYGKIHSNNMAGQALYSLLMSLHKTLFQVSDKHKNDELVDDIQRPGNLRDNARIRTILNAFANELLAGEDNFIDEDKLPEIYASFYRQLMQAQPFTYGNEETLRLFFTAVTEAAQEHDLYLDFRRINSRDNNSLKAETIAEMSVGETKKFEELKPVFMKALDRNISIASSPRKIKPWTKIEDKTIEIAGLRFLTLEQDGEKFLITINGGKVPLYDKNTCDGEDLYSYLQRTIGSKPVDDIRISKEQIKGYLKDVQPEWHDEIDNISLQEGAPLLCANVNPITGLTTRYDAQLNKFLSDRQVTIETLPENYAQLDASLDVQDDFKAVLAIANNRVQAIMKVVDKSVEEAFVGKTPVGQGKNNVVMTMGGMGSGKGRGGKWQIQEAAQGDNYITASLDDERSKFKIYKVMIELNHHADDYMAISAAANLIRDRITKRAIDQHYNLLYDGTGIPYDGHSKNPKLVENWKKSGAKVIVAAAECELYIAPQNRDKFKDTAFERADYRLTTDNRGVPASLIKNRHIEAPLAYLNAFADANIDRFIIVDNAGKKQDNPKIMATSYHFEADEIKTINAAKKSGSLLEYFSQHNLLPNADNSPELREDNVDFLVHKQTNDGYQILAIYNQERFADVIRKGQLNRAAKGAEALPRTPHEGRWIGRTTNENNALAAIARR